MPVTEKAPINDEAQRGYLDYLIRTGKIVCDEYSVSGLPFPDSGTAEKTDGFLKAIEKAKITSEIRLLYDSLERKLVSDPYTIKEEYCDMGQPKVTKYQRMLDTANGSLEFLSTIGGPHDGEMQIIKRKNVLLPTSNQATQEIEERIWLTRKGEFTIRSNIETEEGTRLVERGVVRHEDFCEQVGDQILEAVAGLKQSCGLYLSKKDQAQIVAESTGKPNLAVTKERVNQLIRTMGSLRTDLESRMVSFREEDVLVNTCPEEIFPIRYHKIFNLKSFGVMITLFAGGPNDREVRGEYNMDTQPETGDIISKRTIRFRIKGNGNFSITKHMILRGGEAIEECEVVDGKLRNREACAQTINLIEGVVDVLSRCLRQD
ncbi:MAG: hypothetical protein M1524_03385 [Patescibacteria group bacterium]|nr:hypothetical protein [Patescibacteria group bacterium]